MNGLLWPDLFVFLDASEPNCQEPGSNEIHTHGSNWPAADGCNLCSCWQGTISCTNGSCRGKADWQRGLVVEECQSKASPVHEHLCWKHTHTHTHTHTHLCTYVRTYIHTFAHSATSRRIDYSWWNHWAISRSTTGTDIQIDRETDTQTDRRMDGCMDGWMER